MVSQPVEDPPDPSIIVDLLSSRISIPTLKVLPSTLQLFAHLQLLSERIRREATRALDLHVELIQKLEEDGVDEKLWISHGALRTSEGKALRRIKEQGMGSGELSREDVMMELSFSLRQTHLGLLLATKKSQPKGKLRDLLDTYFPPDITPPPSSSPREEPSHREWLQKVRSHKMCYIRAMTPHQAQIMSLHRKTAEAMFDMVQSSIDEDTPRPSWYDLMPEKKRKADEEMRVYRDDVMDIAKGILRDKQIIDDIFVVVEKEGESDQDEGSDATDEMQDEAIGDGGFPDNASFDQGGEDIEQTREIQDDHQADSFLDDPMENDMEEHTNDDQSQEDLPSRQLVEDDGPRSHSPPPLRLAVTPSPIRPTPTALSHHMTPSRRPRASVQDSEEVSNVSKSKAPRRSGLPPLEGPDYTAHLPSPSYSKDDLRPFDDSRLVHAGQSPNKLKRPRTSDGHGLGDEYRLNAKQRVE